MIITIAGDLCSGKSTIRKLLAKKLEYKHISAGELWREMAAKKNMSLNEINQIIIQNPQMDKEMDENITKLARKEKNFIADGHVLWHFLPESIKIFLTINLDIAAKRVFAEKRVSEKENTSLERTKENIINRTNHEIKRFSKEYNLEYKNLNNFDLVINTTNMTPEEVVNKILEHINKTK